MKKSICSKGERNGLGRREERAFLAELARVPPRTKGRRSDADTPMFGLAPDHDGEIPLELAHRREQCLLLCTERNDGGGKMTTVQGGPMDGAEVTKRSGLPLETRWRVHLHGDTWIAHGGVGGATDIFMCPSTRPSNDGS